MEIREFWSSVLKQDKDAIKKYFHPEAYVRWHNTNEQFTADEYIVANCEYPGKWGGEIERIEQIGDLIITAARVFAVNEPLSFHAVSFIRVKDDQIISIDEYWGDDGDAPQWRKDKKIGTPIR